MLNEDYETLCITFPSKERDDAKVTTTLRCN